MAKKKNTRKKKSAGKKKPTRKKTPTRKKRATRRSAVARRKQASRPTKRSRKTTVPTNRRSPLVMTFDVATTSSRRGMAARSAGQSGDTQGLSNTAEADSESVEELLEEGQAFEAGEVAGVEDADDSQREVYTTQVREDDVPLEYLENDLERLNRRSPSPRKTIAKRTAAPAKRASRGPVDAPGKRHRKPPPQEHLDKRLGEPVGKQAGQKNARTGRRGGAR